MKRETTYLTVDLQHEEGHRKIAQMISRDQRADRLVAEVISTFLIILLFRLSHSTLHIAVNMH